MQITEEERLKFIKEIIGKSYCTLHTHSEYSNIRLRDSINRIEEMLINANDKGLNGLCLTDHELIAGHFELLSAMKELKEDKRVRDDFKVMLGNEIYLVDNDLEELKTKGRFPHFLLIAKDKVGHMALRELTNQAWENYFVRGGMERVPVTYDQMANIIGDKYKGHLVASTACLGGTYAQAILDLIMYETMLKHKEEEIEDVDIESREFQLLLSRYLPHRQAFIKDRWDFIDAFNKTIDRRDLEEIEIVETMIPKMKDYYIKKIEKLSIEEIKEDILNSKKEIHRFIQYCINVFGKEDFYIEIQPSTSNDQVLFNAKGLEIAKAYGLEYIVTTDAHFANKEDITIQEAFLNAQEGDREVLAFYLSCYIQTPEEVIGHLDYISLEDVAKSMENTNIIADKCGKFDLYEQLALFEAEVVENVVFNKDFLDFLSNNKGKYEYVEKFVFEDNVYNRYLIYLSIEGLLNKGLGFEHIYIDRIDKELKEIYLVSEGLQQNMSNYYISTKKFVELMWKVSLVGAGRGSVTGLYIAYLLDITQVDSIKYDLPYTRHIHHSKISLADVDLDSSAIARSKILDTMKEEYGENNVINIGTYGREGTKSTVQTSVRGLGLDDGLGDFLSSLVPVERGEAWSLKDLFEGNEEKERKPLTEFVNEVNKIPHLKETMFKIEGLINKRSIHASGIFFLDEHTQDRLILMRSRNGQKVTQYDMRVAEYELGLVKFDFLTIDALDIITVAMELLIEAGLMEWQCDLKSTYDKYIHPDVLDYDTEEMWEMIAKGELLNLFQFTTDLGRSMAMKTKAKSVIELASANSLMRITTSEEEQPIDKYVRFKDNINDWYDEMKSYGLDNEEIEVAKKLMLKEYGQISTQEDMMAILRDNNITGYDISRADKARKAMSKKDKKAIEKLQGEFFQAGVDLGTRKEFLEYLWETQIKPQLG